jgi:hypothetical protein
VRLRPLLALTAACVLAACGGSQYPAGGTGNGSATRGRLRHAGLDDRPPLVQNQRLGDPHGAVAFAVARDASPTAAAALPAFLRARLSARGFPGVRSRAHALGYSLEAAVPSAAEAKRFVEAVRKALDEPLRAGEPGLEAARLAVRAISERRFAGPAEAAVAACAGELGMSAEEPPWDPRSTAAQKLVAAGLAGARSSKSAAFAAVGPAEIVRAVADALADGEPWPAGEGPLDPWPARGELGVDFATTDSRRLSVAVRVGSADAAVTTAGRLGVPRSRLARRLAALTPGWRVERVSATARPRGACLRVDAVPPHGDPGPSAAEVARALGVVTEEVAVVHAVAEPGSLDEAVLRPTDPAEAAAAAAWRTLVGRQKPGAARQFDAYVTKAAERGHFDLAAAVAARRESRSRPLFDLATRDEPGQARVFALLATTCGTAAEETRNAGEAALVVTALARAGARSSSDVLFEPWIAGDGVGVLAHAPPQSAHEDPKAQAGRIAEALGDLLATGGVEPGEVMKAREELLDQVGREERRGYGLVLENLTQGHPSWLEPRGAFASLENAPEGGFGAALERFLARPLRLAVLANAGPKQAEFLRGELERWIRPVRPAVVRCPTPGRWAPKTGETTLKTLLEAPEGSYYAFPFPGFVGRMPVEAAATLLLLNRPGGLLDQALSDLPGAASAKALGGPEAGALVVQVSAADGQEPLAITRIRALFDRLATTSVSSSDLSFAERELAQKDDSERLDPRRRIVELWRGNAPRAALDASRLTRFHATLRQTGALLVTVVPKP